jgi:hypothetical protein
MISSRHCCVLRLRVLGIVRWNYTCPAAHLRAEVSLANCAFDPHYRRRSVTAGLSGRMFRG